MISDTYCVIMAGGKGTRFWPKSRAQKPKQLLDLLGDRTMVQETLERVSPLFESKNTLIITASEHGNALRSQVSQLPKNNIVIEPFGRNTAPCIALAAFKIAQQNPDACMVVLPADHYIGNPEAFRETLSSAIDAAKHTEALITLGIMPDKPETGYGYIQFGELAGTYEKRDFFKVRRFHEKPQLAVARSFIEQGNFLWNSGMFIWKVSAIKEAIHQYLPEMYQEFEKIQNDFNTPKEDKAIVQAYSKITGVSIDYGVMEHASNVLTIKGDFGWNDIGSWSAIYEVFQTDEQQNAIKGEVIAIETTGSLIFSPHKLTAVIGFENIVVVDTPDALLICPKHKSQDVRVIVEQIEKQGKKDLL